MTSFIHSMTSHMTYFSVVTQVDKRLDPFGVLGAAAPALSALGLVFLDPPGGGPVVSDLEVDVVRVVEDVVCGRALGCCGFCQPQHDNGSKYPVHDDRDSVPQHSVKFGMEMGPKFAHRISWVQ